MAEAGWYTPMLPVAEIERAIPFYEMLGFEVVDTDRCQPLGWARLHCAGGALMLVRAESPVDPAVQAPVFYLYSPDLPALRERLVASGVPVSEIHYPDYLPSGEFHLRDPDGYRLAIVHWGEKEHSEWLKRIGRESA